MVLPDASRQRDRRPLMRKMTDRLMGRDVLASTGTGLIEEPAPARLGVCCSGGGVRSASYNLGALQVLEEQDELPNATYLTSVSGGSYIAGARSIVETQTLRRTPDAGNSWFGRESPEENWLRCHSDYIAPGLAGKLRILLQFVAGFATNLAAIGIFLYVVGRPVGWLYQELLFPHLRWGGPNPFATIEPWMWWAVAFPSALAVGSSWIEIVFRPRKTAPRAWLLATGRVTATVAGILFVALVAIPYLVLFLRHGFNDLPVFVQSLLDAAPRKGTDVAKTPGIPDLLWPMLVAFAMTVVRAAWAKQRARMSLFLAMVLGPSTLVLTAIWFISGGAGWLRPGPLAIWGVLVIAFAAFYYYSDLTNWSGHPFYKMRLATAYATYRTDPDTVAEVPHDHLVRISESQPAHWPQLVVCAAANVSDAGATPSGRNATSFTFSSSQVGGPVIGAVPTKEFETLLGRRARDMTLLAAVAVSGAAVAPSMGKATRRPLRFLFAIAGISLGVWLPNPRWYEQWQEEGKVLSRNDRPRLIYLFKELFGLNSLDSKFLYITDGGHFENLGLVELLRRGCTQIYCFDASGDQDTTFYTLGEAVAIARSDLGVDISIDPSPLLPDGEGEHPLCRSDHTVAQFRYPDGTEGVLVYVKASVTKDSPYETLAYRQRHPDFPHDPTLDQLFDDEKFEAYWSLGRSGAARGVDAMRRARTEQGLPRPVTPSGAPPGAAVAGVAS